MHIPKHGHISKDTPTTTLSYTRHTTIAVIRPQVHKPKHCHTHTTGTHARMRARATALPYTSHTRKPQHFHTPTPALSFTAIYTQATTMPHFTGTQTTARTDSHSSTVIISSQHYDSTLERQTTALPYPKHNSIAHTPQPIRKPQIYKPQHCHLHTDTQSTALSYKQQSIVI